MLIRRSKDNSYFLYVQNNERSAAHIQAERHGDVEMTDWKCGDLALCVLGNGWTHFAKFQKIDGPSTGYVGKVVGLRDAYGLQFLQFEEWPRHFLASCFRRIDPLPDSDAISFMQEIKMANEVTAPKHSTT